MGGVVDIGPAIKKRDITDAALVMAAARQTFTARDFSDFLHAAGQRFEPEIVNDWLCEMVTGGRLREIGPGVYGRPVSV